MEIAFNLLYRDPKRLPVERLIRNTLKQVMMDMDLDKCTSRDIRVALESVVRVVTKKFIFYSVVLEFGFFQLCFALKH